jgi:hypothetical protein
MREHPDHHDAELLLRLYDLRREEKLRQAREWFMGEFRAESFEDAMQRFPRGSRENAQFRMVASYWDMVASIVSHGLIQAEFFFENTSEFWIVWQKIKSLAPAARRVYQNPFYWKNLETLCEKYEKWMAGRAPDALETLRKLILERSNPKPE